MESRMKLARLSFDKYYHSFTELSIEQKVNFDLKYKHSYRVADVCGQLADALGIGSERRFIALIIGLFHDIGRFKQLFEFNTFNDAVSVDHARYSVEVLQENKFLDDLNEMDIVLDAIRYHNKLKVPIGLSSESLFFAKLIRDADKLDILKVITDHYTTPEKERNQALTWEMPQGEEVSSKVLAQILAHEQIAKENLRNQLDIKVMQLSWVFDLNFKPSLKILKEKGYMDIIYQTMPQNELSYRIYHEVTAYLERLISNRSI
ncbi:HD domain-containing protein [Saccharicrinis fermentans]|uniref:Putative HD superfamily hydrolase n=1 Tax=Saccharicrinis fermentans DSM 9555 = JCM 21142 TaxID=869213 RepID=W7Y7L1_9BACT|nr:HD domain-containing protein [Saccharicrinis fermentans]GAF03638.1 putative HD superfamily hydrolase [Saccharicrinis fermentans DSM 9555 = JCM 21142]